MLSIMSMMKREIDTQRILIDDTVPMVRSLYLLFVFEKKGKWQK